MYELHRTPQEAITDGTEISISPRSLHSELMCPICLDMLKNTMTTKEVGVQVCSSLCYMHSYIKIDQFSVMFFFPLGLHMCMHNMFIVYVFLNVIVFTQILSGVHNNSIEEWVRI